MKPFLTRWLCTTLALAIVVKFRLTGLQADSWGALIGTALFLGILNALVRPIVLLLSAPFIIVTLGFFILVINAGMLALAGSMVNGFHVYTFWNALFGALLVSIVSWALSLFFRGPDGEYHLITHHHAEPKRVQGRVIE